MPLFVTHLLLAAVWILLVEAMALAALSALRPLTRAPLGAWDLAPARIFAVFATALVVWLGRSDPAPATLSALFLAVMAAAAAFFARTSRAPSAAGAPAPGSAPTSPPADWIAAEACYLVPFGIFLALRGFMPDLTSAEKMPDFSIFQIMPLASAFPAPDPWFAGHSTNYYVFGHLALALPGTWLGQAPEVSYHIALAFIGGASFAAMASLVRKLTGSWSWGAVGGSLLVFAGNLDGLRQLVKAGGAGSFDYWQSSRVIPDVIDEFPFFALLHGDLHAHVIAYLPQLLMLTACARLAAPAPRGSPPARPLLLAAFALGTSWVVNTWDVPILAALLFGSLITGTWLGDSALRPLSVARVTALGLAAVTLGFILFLPFHLSYRPPVAGVRLYEGEPHFGAYLVHFAALLLPVSALLAATCFRRAAGGAPARWPGTTAGDGVALLACGGLAAAIVLFLLFRRGVVALNVPLLAIALAAALARKEYAFPALLFAVALAFLALCEVIYVDDTYEPPLERMNTVFKIYSGLWPILAAAAALSLKSLNDEVVLPFGWLASGLAFALLPATVVYPLLAPRATGAFAAERPWSLDGLAYLARSQPDEYAAIEWLRGIAPGCPASRIVEAVGDPYTLHARLSSYASIPSVLGWANHMIVWRGPAGTPEVLERQKDVAEIYRSGDPAVIRPLLDRYEVTLVAIGSLEKRDYPAASLAALRVLLPVAYHSGGMEILSVPGRECP